MLINLNASKISIKEDGVPKLGQFSSKRTNRNPLGDLSQGGNSGQGSKKRRLCDIS